MLLYHGSIAVVDNPQVDFSQRRVDFGQGFYTTTNLQQATRWAKIKRERTGSEIGYVNVYQVPDELMNQGFNTHTFRSASGAWLDFVVNNRRSNQRHQFDIVKGPVANDNVYETITLYESGTLSRNETIARLKVRKLYDQISFHHPEAAKLLRLVNTIVVR